MRSDENTLYAALLRAQGFSKENAAQFSNSVDLTGALRRLDEVVDSFSTHALDQRANDRDARGETAKQQQLRLKLRTEQMQPVAEIARRNLRNTPEFKALQMPKQRVNGPAFIADAEGMAQAATVHKDTLIERGLPADFLDQFQNGISQLKTSVTDRENSRTRRMGATQALGFQNKEGRSVLKVLDSLMQRALNGNESLLGAWAGARAIHRRSGGTKVNATAGQPVTTTPTTPATTATAGASTPEVTQTPAAA